MEIAGWESVESLTDQKSKTWVFKNGKWSIHVNGKGMFCSATLHYDELEEPVRCYVTADREEVQRATVDLARFAALNPEGPPFLVSLKRGIEDAKAGRVAPLDLEFVYTEPEEVDFNGGNSED